jgi:hypothetical protein
VSQIGAQAEDHFTGVQEAAADPAAAFQEQAGAAVGEYGAQAEDQFTAAQETAGGYADAAGEVAQDPGAAATEHVQDRFNGQN